MLIIVFCEECGEKLILEEAALADSPVDIVCRRCGEVNHLTGKEVKGLTCSPPDPNTMG
ncbi:MAG: hypothetical protein HQK55_11320 [Deltaproteobacteria bacterium]|nr:hypothetical protein [Deltaproteobacteria bacterium]